jgi:hypothetical protein
MRKDVGVLWVWAWHDGEVQVRVSEGHVMELFHGDSRLVVSLVHTAVHIVGSVWSTGRVGARQFSTSDHAKRSLEPSP